MTFQEEIGQIRVRDALVGRNYFSRPSELWVRNINSLEAYLTSVSLYTARQLSYEIDVLSAFAGVGNVVSKRMGTFLFFGLPEKHFQRAMLWHSVGRDLPRSGVPHIPSWSWAAWSGPVNFEHPSSAFISDRDTGTLVKFHIQDSDRGLVPLNAEETWFGTSKDFNDSSCLDEDKIAKKFMPSATASALIWKDCTHSPWASFLNVNLDPQACKLAEKYPGCLVFNTTTASLWLKKSTKKSHVHGNSDSDSEDEDEGQTARALSDKTEKVSLDICDKTRFKIGRIVMDRHWIKKKVDLNHEHSFIILCGHLLPKSSRRELLFDRGVPLVGPWSQAAFLDFDPDRVGSAWLLTGMLVERHQGIAQRLGLGYVETRLWNRAEPKWETIVLT
ncbi:MAG: hypothetical protein M1822_008289 [Bathelium mastoideum]|nr:MAG: hypothetical protein M1822_008289 [Bathelium mastoideum]